MLLDFLQLQDSYVIAAAVGIFAMLIAAFAVLPNQTPVSP
jgi:hypothetical protein